MLESPRLGKLKWCARFQGQLDRGSTTGESGMNPTNLFANGVAECAAGVEAGVIDEDYAILLAAELGDGVGGEVRGHVGIGVTADDQKRSWRGLWTWGVSGEKFFDVAIIFPAGPQHLVSAKRRPGTGVTGLAEVLEQRDGARGEYVLRAKFWKDGADTLSQE